MIGICIGSLWTDFCLNFSNCWAVSVSKLWSGQKWSLKTRWKPLFIPTLNLKEKITWPSVFVKLRKTAEPKLTDFFTKTGESLYKILSILSLHTFCHFYLGNFNDFQYKTLLRFFLKFLCVNWCNSDKKDEKNSLESSWKYLTQLLHPSCVRMFAKNLQRKQSKKWSKLV